MIGTRRGSISGRIRLWLPVVAGLLSLPRVATPQDKPPAPRLYVGPARLTGIRGTIELVAGASPSVRLDIALRNADAKPETLQIGFRGGPATQVSLGARDTARIALAPVAQRSGSPTGTQSANLDLALEVNGLPVAGGIDTVDVRIVLPLGVPALIRSSLPVTRETSGERVSYRLVRSGAHLTMLNLVYTTGPVTLSIDKRVQPAVIDRPGPVTVTLTIRNLGNVVAHGIRLDDSYDPRDFSGQGADFQLVAGKENDRRLVWSRSLDALASGASTNVTYVLTALLPVESTSLSAVTASINGQLVGVSNKVWLTGKGR